LSQLGEEQRRTFAAALAGLDKLGGVRLVGEQVTALLGPNAHGFEVSVGRLVVWTDAERGSEAAYELAADHDGKLIPLPTGSPLPALDGDRLFFERTSLAWEAWVEAWEQEQAGKGLPESLLGGIRLLPAVPAQPACLAAAAAGSP
jgi:hypothetical protein